MFLDVLELVSDSFSSVVSALDVSLFNIGNVSITFWELILGLLTVSIVFGFFLAPRSGSVLGAAGNVVSSVRQSDMNSKRQLDGQRKAAQANQRANERKGNK